MAQAAPSAAMVARSVWNRESTRAGPDKQLLQQFVSGPADVAEAAFASLVERYGPIVHRVCLDVLGNSHETADAAQAVFGHDGPALLDVVTTPDATEVPSHIPPEDAKGFALSLGKMVLDGGVGEVANIARLNVRNIPRP